MKKKLILSFLLVTIISLNVSGSEDINKNVTLESLETQIINNNLEIKRANENIMIAEYKLDKAEDDQGRVMSTSIETAKTHEYYIDEANMNLDYANWQLKEKEEALTLLGQEYYYTYLLLLEELQLQQQKIERLYDELDNLNSKLILGLTTQSAINESQLAIDKETLALESLSNQKKSLFLDLNLLMNNNLDTSLLVNSARIPYQEYNVENLNELIEETLTEHGELIKLDAEGDLLSLESRIYDDYNSNDQYDRTIININEKLSQKRFDYKDLKLSLEYDIRIQYNNILNAYDTYRIQELTIKNLELELDVKQKRYDVGLETESTIKELKEQLAFSKLEFKKIKLDYYLVVEKFKNLLK